MTIEKREEVSAQQRVLPPQRSGGMAHPAAVTIVVTVKGRIQRAPAARAALEDLAVVEHAVEQGCDGSGVAEQLSPVLDAHRVQRILRRASVTTTTGTYGHLAAGGPARSREPHRTGSVC